MKKLFKRIKKIIVGIVVGIITLPNRIFGAIDINTQFLYGPPSEDIHISEITNTSDKIIKTLILPIILIIGLLVYLVKSKNKKKYLIAIIISVLCIITYIFISKSNY